MSSIVTLGIDLAKAVSAIHGVDAAGKPVLVRPSVPRAKLLDLIASIPPCMIGMEACSGAHHWARLFQAHGHTVRLMGPKFIAPYRLSGKRGKNDVADAAAICTASTHSEPARDRLDQHLAHPLTGHAFALPRGAFLVGPEQIVCEVLGCFRPSAFHAAAPINAPGRWALVA